MKILVILNNHNCISLLRLCLKIKDSYKKDVSIIGMCLTSSLAEKFHSILSNESINYKILSKNSVDDLNFSDKSNYTPKNNTFWISKFKKILNSTIFNSTIFYKFREMIISHNLKLYKKTTKNYFSQNNVTAVLSMADRTHDYIESSILYNARLLKIKVILPYIAHYDIKSALIYRKNKNGEISSEFNPFKPISLYKLIAYFRFKKQLYNKVFYQAPYILNAHKKEKTLSHYPWWIGNGNSDLVCVDSKYTLNKFLDNRVLKDKIVITGHPQYDEIYKCKQDYNSIYKKLSKQYNFNIKKKLIIFSLPQHAEQGFIKFSEHFHQIKMILNQLVMIDCNVIISMHPRQNFLDYNFIFKDYNFNISKDPLHKIIATADLFIASNSSTSVWSALCGIPSLNIVGPTENLYKHLKSIIYVDEINKISETALLLFKKKLLNFSDDWDLLSRDKVFDGKFIKRFIALLNSNIT